MASALTQWGVLTRRTLETLVRNRLTLAIMIGSPAMVIDMFVILFQRGAFDFDDPIPSSPDAVRATRPGLVRRRP